MRLRWLLALVSIAPATFLAAQTLTSQPSPATGRWLTDYAQARSESRRLNMPLVVHFSATWCGPCQVMERETLNTPAVRQVLGRDVIGVKLDFDRDRGLADAFRVEMVPADIVVAPDGKILGSRTGQQQARAYTAALQHWGSRFERPTVQPASPARPLPLANDQSMIAAAPTRPRPMPPQQPLVPQALGQPGPSSQPPVPAVPQEPAPLVGLDGYSPVRIMAHRQWIRGQREYAAIWEGVVYFLTSEEERRLFIATPQKYAPRMLGCDPVTLTESGRLVQGSIECGAFYDGSLYLFRSKDSRGQFKLNPEQFLMSRGPLRAAAVAGRRLY